MLYLTESKKIRVKKGATDEVYRLTPEARTNFLHVFATNNRLNHRADVGDDELQGLHRFAKGIPFW